MGIIHVPVTLRATRKNRRSYEDRFLVDTGATDCMAPASELRKAGIERCGRMGYELANGRKVTYGYGLAVISFMGETTAGRVIFGPERTEPILGVTAMESVGVVIDPARQKLKRLPSVPLKRISGPRSSST